MTFKLTNVVNSAADVLRRYLFSILFVFFAPAAPLIGLFFVLMCLYLNTWQRVCARRASERLLNVYSAYIQTFTRWTFILR